MWKYVSRRIRDSFERSANHFDKRSSTSVVTSPNVPEENGRPSAPCFWFSKKKCWRSFHSNNGTKSKRWNFDHLNRNWIGAITWSGALVFGWYTSQLIFLKLKYRDNSKKSLSNINCLFTSLYPYVNCVSKRVNSIQNIQEVIGGFAPTLHLISNENNGVNKERIPSTSSNGTESSDDDLGEVLNSIENKLGLAAIENGQHEDGLNLLRSAATRNHAPALYNLGLCYEMGLGVAIDEKVAMEFYRSAATLQHPGALYNLGVYYGQGRGGLTCDKRTATRLLRLAAVQGQQNAIDALKELEIDTSEPVPNNDVGFWLSHCLPFTQNNIVPTHSTLFVENIGHQHLHNFFYEPKVY